MDSSERGNNLVFCFIDNLDFLTCLAFVIHDKHRLIQGDEITQQIDSQV